MSDHVRESPSRRRRGCRGRLGCRKPGSLGTRPKGGSPALQDRGGQDWQKREPPAGRLPPAAMQGTGTAVHSWAARRAGSLTRTLHSAGSVPRVKQLPLGVPRARLPGEASGPGRRAAQGPLGLSVPRKQEAMPSQETPPTHTHTQFPVSYFHHPSRPPAVPACPSRTWGTQRCRVTRVSPTT